MLMILLTLSVQLIAAPAIFKQIMDIFLSQLREMGAYLDDIAITGSPPNKLKVHLVASLRHIRDMLSIASW